MRVDARGDGWLSIDHSSLAGAKKVAGQKWAGAAEKKIQTNCSKAVTAASRSTGSCRRHVEGDIRMHHMIIHVTPVRQGFCFRPHPEKSAEVITITATTHQLPFLHETPSHGPNQGQSSSLKLRHRISELIGLIRRCSPAPLPVPRPRWSPAEASTPPAPASPRPTTTPRAPTPTSPSTPAASTLLSATGDSWPPASSSPSALPVRSLPSSAHSGCLFYLTLFAVYQTKKPQ